MLNYIWLTLLLSGIVVAALNGNIDSDQAALQSANDAVAICINLIGVMCLWLGIMRIGEKRSYRSPFPAGQADYGTAFSFYSSRSCCPGAIIMNLSANILGLGSATPFGLKAMQELQKLNGGRKEASEGMCTFRAIILVLPNPATIIAVRVNFNSANPTEIVGATIFATSCSMIMAVLVDYLFRRANRRTI